MTEKSEFCLLRIVCGFSVHLHSCWLTNVTVTVSWAWRLDFVFRHHFDTVQMQMVFPESWPVEGIRVGNPPIYIGYPKCNCLRNCEKNHWHLWRECPFVYTAARNGSRVMVGYCSARYGVLYRIKSAAVLVAELLARNVGAPWNDESDPSAVS